MGFAKAVVLAQRLSRIASIAPLHGLSDKPSQSTKIEQLVVKVQQRGVFQEFNDAVALAARFSYYRNSMTEWVAKPFDTADRMAGAEIGLKDTFARIPALARLYEKTFQEATRTLLINLHSNQRSVQLRIPHYRDRPSAQFCLPSVCQRLSYIALVTLELKSRQGGI